MQQTRAGGPGTGAIETHHRIFETICGCRVFGGNAGRYPTRRKSKIRSGKPGREDSEVLMKKATLGRTEMTPIDSIKPYWRNPRRISDEAIERLAHSIQEYGYQQPLVVDEKNVLIVGHTRYAAMRRLGVETGKVMIAVYLKPKQIEKVQLIDRKSTRLNSS